VWRPALVAVLEGARARGLLGPGPVAPHIDHALAFAAPVVGELRGWEQDAAAAVDLGTGAGLPGLVLACAFPATTWLLVDGRQRSTGFLAEAVEELALEARVEVRTVRAEELGREPAHRGRHRLVVARGFGPPAALAECAAPLLEVGGRLVVSEPPGPRPDRWPASPLAGLGLRYEGRLGTGGATVAVLSQAAPCPEGYPRRVGIPTKRPLFGPPEVESRASST